MALHINFQGTALEFIEILVTSVRNYGQIWRPGVKDGLGMMIQEVKTQGDITK
jgi:hypothetical protein